MAGRAPVTSAADARLRRRLGPAAVIAVVVGDIVGSGIYFTPGELSAVAREPWQVYFFWGLCGLITLCASLTLAELSVLLPRAGASYHIVREGFGPFWGFVKIWIELWVSGPGSVAGVAILVGESAAQWLGPGIVPSPVAFGAVAIAAFAAVNLAGVEWGGRTQIALTTIKLGGLFALVAGALFLAPRAEVTAPALAAAPTAAQGLLDFARVVGLGVAVVLFTYDGWVDVSHLAGEVKDPRRNLPLGLGGGVAAVTAIYLVVNFAYLRVVPLQAMREAPLTVANRVAAAAFGPGAGGILSALIAVSTLGALGGLVMTLPRLFYAAAARYEEPQVSTRSTPLFRLLSRVSSGSAVPSGSILFCATLSIAALLFFGSFSRLVTFFVVPVQAINILMVAAVFRLRRRPDLGRSEYRTWGYPWVPLFYIVVMASFLASALVYTPRDTLLGVALTATALPAYLWLNSRRKA